jgi:two-component system chemotaxis response regulator CheB
MTPRSRVLIVDDSALMRHLLKGLVSADPGLEAVGAASNPATAWRSIERLAPDVLALGAEERNDDALALLESLARRRPTPTVMLLAPTPAGEEAARRARALGASHVVTRPLVDIERGTAAIAAELVAKLKAARGRPRPPAAPPVAPAAAPAAAASPSPRPARPGAPPIIAIGSSTGGTEALRELLTALPADAPGVVVVQHMPEGFTRQFARRLDGLCAIRVREARDGDPVVRGQALIAPGGANHMELVRRGDACAVRVFPGPPVNHHRPSVDVLFRSCSTHLGASAVGVILTGMGGDGARGLLAMKLAGARTIAQDEATCVVFGMPKEAIAAGGVDYVMPLGRIAHAAVSLCTA